MSLHIFNHGLLMVLVIGAGVGCEDKPVHGERVEARPAPVVPVAPVAPPRPWFEGSWTGTASLKAGPETLERDQAERAGKEAPAGPETTKTLELTAEISAGGDVSGRATLGSHDLVVRGLLDENVLRVKLSGDGVQATLIAGRAREAEPKNKFEGTLTASLTEAEAGKVSAHTFSGPVELSVAP